MICAAAHLQRNSGHLQGGAGYLCARTKSTVSKPSKKRPARPNGEPQIRFGKSVEHLKVVTAELDETLPSWPVSPL